jgi:hypothetical protein
VDHVFCSWGQKAQVVNVPATNPSRSIPVIGCYPSAGLTLPCDAGLPHQTCLSRPIALWYISTFEILYRYDWMKECTRGIYMRSL